MPLDAFKSAHILAKLALIDMGRTQQIVLTLKLANGTTTQLIVPAIWKPYHDMDPSLMEAGPGTGTSEDDILASFNLADVSLAQMRSCIYAYPQTPTGAEPANRYIVTSITPKGLLPGGDRIVVTFDRQR